MPSDSLFTFQNLGTIGGASLLCFLIVAYTKDLVDKWTRKLVPTNVYSLFVGTAILMLVLLNIDSSALSHWQTYFLSLANGFLVSATASHTNELSLKFPKLPKKTKDDETQTFTGSPVTGTVNGLVQDKSIWFQGNEPVYYGTDPSSTGKPFIKPGPSTGDPLISTGTITSSNKTDKETGTI